MVILLGACFVITEAVFAQSQSATATLTGRVTDPSGAIVVGADVELLATETGAIRTGVVDSAGLYNVSNLPQGTYKLTVRMKGFSDVIVFPINLQVGQTANIDLSMKTGVVTQQVEISSSALRLQTQTSDLSTVLPPAAISQLPTVARNPLELVALMPGVTASYINGQGKGGANAPGSNNSLDDSGRVDFEASGASYGYLGNTILLDGININAQSADGQESPKILPTVDATQEFSLITNNLPPEYGRGANVINIITKSGTNALHGTLYEFNQNTVFDANSYLNKAAGIPRNAFNKNQFGGTLGGPVYIPHLYNGRDHSWFFVNLESLRSITPGTTFITIPTQAEMNGNFSGLVTTSGTPITIYDPQSQTTGPNGVVLRQPFPGNIIPANRLSAFAQNVAKFYPSPNAPGGQRTANGMPTNINNFQENTPNALYFSRIMIRGDHQFNANNQLMLRFEEDPEWTPYNSVYGNLSSPVSLGRHTHFHNAEVSYTWTISPTFVLQQSIGWVQEQYLGPNFSPNYNPTPLGGPFTSNTIQSWAQIYAGGTAFPHITLSGGYGDFGNSGLSYYNGNNGNFAYNVNFSKEHGRHDFKWGFQWIYDPQDQINGLGTTGDYNFTGQFTQGNNPLEPTANTGDAFADFLLGYPYSGGISSGQTFTASSKYAAWYFLDNWRATPRLTFNLGLRYEFTDDFTDRFNETGGFDPFIQNPIGNQIGPNTNGGTLNQSLGRTLYGGMVFAGTADVNGNRRLIPNDYSNVGPRLGFAYQLTHSLVLRGGVGRIYALSLASAADSGAQGTSAFFITTPITGTIDGINPAVTIDNPFPGGLLTPPGASQGSLTGIGLPLEVGVIGPMKTPYLNEWNFGVQYAATQQSVLSVAYAGAYAKRLPCPGGFCGDQLSLQTLSQYGSALFNLVPNPFYKIITNTSSPLSVPSVQMSQLLKTYPQYPGGSVGTVPAIQGQNNWSGFDETTQRYPFFSNFNALEVSYEMRSFHGLTLLVAYTLSKHVTDADGSFLSGFQNAHAPDKEATIGPTDIPNRLVISHVFDLPLGTGKLLFSDANHVVNGFIGGWQLSGIITLASGFPLPITQAPNNLDALLGAQRPNVIHTPYENSGTRSQRVSQWFANPTGTFAAAAPFTYGDAPLVLSTIRSDPQKNYDVSLIKITPIDERFKTEFRFTAFNVFNRPWFAEPNTTFGSPTFGLVSSLNGPPRSLELGMKLTW